MRYHIALQISDLYFFDVIYRDYPIFLSKPEDDETVMLRISKTIPEFGAANFVCAKILITYENTFLQV